MPASLPNNNENSATHQHRGQEIIEVGEQNGNQEDNIEIVNRVLGNSPGNNKRKREKSKVWEEMTKYEGKDGKVCAKCTYCEKVFDGSSKKGTTHLKNHLERCPVKRKNGGGDADKSMKTTVDLTSSGVSKEESVMDLIEIENFLMNGDSSALNLRKTEILKVYDDQKDKLRQFLGNLSCRFSLRIELFFGFYVLAVHYIDDSWERRWKIISCFRKSDYLNHTKSHYRNLVEALKKSCSDLKIDRNICSIIYNFTEDGDGDDVIREINSWLSQPPSLPFGGSLLDIDKFYQSLSSLSNVLSKVNNSKSIGLAVGFKEVFCKLEQIDPDFKSINLTKEEWDDATITYKYFNELTSIWPSLYDCEYTTPNMCFPKFCDVYIKLLQQRTSEGYHPVKKTSPLTEKLASSILQNFFDRYWIKYNSVLVITAILDPRFKMEIVQLWYNKIYGNGANSYLEKSKGDFIKVYKEYARCGSAKGYYTSSISYLDAMGRPRTSSEGVSSKSELDRYLKDDPKCPLYEKFDILAWWRANTEIYPTLARMARDFLAIPIHFIFPSDDIDGILNLDLDNDISSALACFTNWLGLER